MKYFIPLLAVVLVACGGKTANDASDEELMRDEVRNYLFLDDSIKVSATIVDTILVEDLDGMLATVEDNLDKIQWDIDTLESMIDTLAYDNMEYENSLYPESIDFKMAPRRLQLSEYKLKMADLLAMKLSFQQSKRVMLHLRRAQLNTVAGYEILANYVAPDQEEIELSFLMTPDFKIVD